MKNNYSFSVFFALSSSSIIIMTNFMMVSNLFWALMRLFLLLQWFVVLESSMVTLVEMWFLRFLILLNNLETLTTFILLMDLLLLWLHRFWITLIITFGLIQMRKTHGGKNKFDLVYGSILVPLEFDPCFKTWNHCNMLVHSWITSSIEESIALSIVFLKNEIDVCNVLEQNWICTMSLIFWW